MTKKNNNRFTLLLLSHRDEFLEEEVEDFAIFLFIFWVRFALASTSSESSSDDDDEVVSLDFLFLFCWQKEIFLAKAMFIFEELIGKMCVPFWSPHLSQLS